MLTIKALFLAIAGYVMYSWDNFTYTKASENIDKSLSMKNVWGEYKEYWLEHEPNMTAPNTCTPHSEDKISKLEDFLSFKLPEDLKTSFRTVNHFSKKCDDDLVHSWFGSKTGIELYTPTNILTESKNMQKHIQFSKRDYKIYNGNIEHLSNSETNWPRDWVPIFSKYDITFFIDLRNDIKSGHGQIIGYLHTFEGLKNEGKPPNNLLEKLDNYHANPNNSFHNFVFVAKDYKTFMQFMLEEIKENGELKDRYLTNLFKLRADYFW